MEECRCRRPAGKVKYYPRRVRQEIPVDKRVEAKHRDLRERSGMGEGAAAPGRTDGRAGNYARRGTRSDLVHDARIDASTKRGWRTEDRGLREDRSRESEVGGRKSEVGGRR